MEIEGVNINIQDEYPLPHEIQNRIRRDRSAARTADSKPAYEGSSPSPGAKDIEVKRG